MSKSRDKHNINDLKAQSANVHTVSSEVRDPSD